MLNLKQLSYQVSDKHKAAQEKIASYLRLYFRVVKIEFDAPVPNPARIMGDLKERSTITHHLDVNTEVPIWRKIESVKYTRFGIEIDCNVGHKNTILHFQIT